MLHEPVESENECEDLTLAVRTRMGVRLFLVYATVYGIFVAINLIKPVLMERIVLFGMNLAVTYGIGLIVFAIVLALIYNRRCAQLDRETLRNTVSGKEG
jgi:uncharacterized membrane protein (DUF485 family)